MHPSYPKELIVSLVKYDPREDSRHDEVYFTGWKGDGETDKHAAQWIRRNVNGGVIISVPVFCNEDTPNDVIEERVRKGFEYFCYIANCIV